MKKLFVGFLAIFLLIIWIREDIAAGRNKVQKIKQSRTHLGDIQLYTDGHGLYKALFSDIRKAKTCIYVHFYIIEKDEIGRKFLALLEKKAKQGVEVKLSADWFGSHKLTTAMIKDLKKSGVQFTFSGKPTWPHIFYTLQNRNHRRMTIIDGTTVYIGGFNMGKEYLSKDKKFGHWRDYHLRISGGGTQEIEKQFLLDWEKDTEETSIVHHPSLPIKKGSSPYRYVFSDGKGLAEHYKNMFRKAKKSIVIATPYFIPGKDVTSELLQSKKRGVTIKILVPAESDVPFVKQAAYPFLRELLKQGAEIYRYQHGFFHGKVMVIDGKLADIGTANFDTRSFFLNDESNCLVSDGPVLTAIKSELEKDFRQSKHISESYFEKLTIWDRLLEKVISVFAYYL